MTTVGIRELQRDTSAVVARVHRTGRPTFVTNHGEPVAAVVPVDPDALEEFVLANAPAFVRSRARADAELAAGGTRPASEVFAVLRGDRQPERNAEPAPVPRLTAREHTILILLLEGKTAQEIAESLEISPRTARGHLKAILGKLERSTP